MSHQYHYNSQNQGNYGSGNQWSTWGKQEQKSNVKLIQDLKYSHETLLGTLSTL
jgi:hypothetical protein